MDEHKIYNVIQKPGCAVRTGALFQIHDKEYMISRWPTGRLIRDKQLQLNIKPG